jgi:hypothetical protein
MVSYAARDRKNYQMRITAHRKERGLSMLPVIFAPLPAVVKEQIFYQGRRSQSQHNDD